MTVLILSSMQDVHARAVMEALAARGAHAELLDSSEFPSRLSITMAFEEGNRRLAIRRQGGGHLDLSEVNAVWWRRPQPFKLPEALAEPSHRRFALSEASTAFQGLYRLMDAFWVNDPLRDSAAHHKPWQLALAQKAGLEIPPTLMTSDPEEARHFIRQREGRIIYKQFVALPDSWRETREFGAEEAKLIEAVRLTPVIFQRYVEAAFDLRVTAIGDRFYAASADLRKVEYPLDVRLNLDARYEPHQLPPAIEARLRTMMQWLGLEYGAIDLRLTPDGRYVFLEINPAGQFLYIEYMTGQKIAAALAEHLISAPHRPCAAPG